MKKDLELWTCDLCGTEQTFTKGCVGGSYFPGWVVLDIISIHGPGVYASGEVSGKHTFCCLTCAIAFLQRVSEEKKKSDKKMDSIHKDIQDVRQDLIRSFRDIPKGDK